MYAHIYVNERDFKSLEASSMLRQFMYLFEASDLVSYVLVITLRFYVLQEKPLAHGACTTDCSISNFRNIFAW